MGFLCLPCLSKLLTSALIASSLVSVLSPVIKGFTMIKRLIFKDSLISNLIKIFPFK